MFWDTYQNLPYSTYSVIPTFFFLKDKEVIQFPKEVLLFMDGTNLPPLYHMIF